MRQLSVLILFTASLAVGSAFQACEREWETLAHFHSQGSVSETKQMPGHDPLKAWVEHLITRRNIKQNDRAGFTQAFDRFKYPFEEDLIELIENHRPDQRSNAIEKLVVKYNMTPEQIQRAIEYYAITVWEDLRLAGTPSHVAGELQRIRRELRLTNPQRGSAESRYYYYLNNVTRQAIPEMAKELKRTEHSIYHELSFLEISVEKEFNRPLSAKGLLGRDEKLIAKGHRSLIPKLSEIHSPLEQAIFLKEEGVSVAVISEALGFGEQALTFILCYRRELTRGVPWTSLINFRGHQMTQEQAVAEMRSAQMPIQEIADALNKAAGTTDPAHPEYRTAGAVAARLQLLGLRNPRTALYPNDITLPPPFGQVKQSGKLHVENTSRFIAENPFKDLAVLAHQLGVQPESLKQFIERHNLFHVSVLQNRPRKARTAETSYPSTQKWHKTADEILAIYDEQFAQMLDRFSKTDGGVKYFTMPDGKQFPHTHPESKFGIHGKEWAKALVEASKLPEEVQNMLLSLAKGLPENLGNLVRSQKGSTYQRTNTIRLFDFLSSLITAHNEAVTKNKETPDYYPNKEHIPDNWFESIKGVEKALDEIRGLTQYKAQLATFSQSTGGVAYFLLPDGKQFPKTHPDSKFGNHSNEWAKTLVEASKSPKEIQNTLLLPLAKDLPEKLGPLVRNQKGAAQQRTNTTRLFDFLSSLITAHNEAVTKNTKTPDYYPNKERIPDNWFESPENMAAALEKLRS